MAVAIQTFHSQRLGSRKQKLLPFKSVSFIWEKKSSKSLTDFFLCVIRKYWFISRGNLAKGNGVSSAWVGRAHSLP